uniref:Uncharacterized protein n=1 Tax=Acrobeloides nanus TaxID=290746 RepID=A0A914CS53_9BILA
MLNFPYLDPYKFLRKAVTTRAYWPTYMAYGGAGFFLMIYYFEWKSIGKYIPVWNQYRNYLDEPKKEKMTKLETEKE